MSSFETIFFWSSLFFYCLACGGFIYSFVFMKPRLVPLMTILVAIGLAAHSAAIGARYLAQGHLPWSGDYEYALMGGWFITAGTLLIGWRNRSLQAMASVSVPFVILMMGYGFMSTPRLAPMAASLKTLWLYVHVYFAWLSFSAFTLAMALGVLYLLKEKNSARETSHPVYERMPSLSRLDELIFRYITFGFITDSIMIVAGSIWAKNLWGSYWSWDPVETWSLISYIVYGTAIHLRVTMGWRGTRMAWLAITLLSTVIISFFGVTYLVKSSLHIFQVR
jgi:cytochrome c-type biogenesis protein CcsB